MYNKIRNQILYLLSFRSIMFLVLIFLLPILACTVTSSGNEATGNEETGNEGSGWFSNEPDKNDLKQVQDFSWVLDDDESGKQSAYSVSVWENKRKDYWAENVHLTTNLYANDGSVLDSVAETIDISAGGTYLIEAEFSDIGSKINRIETIIDDIVYWQKSDPRISEIKIEVSPSLSKEPFWISGIFPEYTGFESPVFLVENSSDYEITDVELRMLFCTENEEFCTQDKISNDQYSDTLSSGQSFTYEEDGYLLLKTTALIFVFRGCGNNIDSLQEGASASEPKCYQEILDKVADGSYQYWLTYTTHFGELVSIEGEIK